MPLEPINEELVIDLDSDAPRQFGAGGAGAPRAAARARLSEIPEPVTQQLVRRPRERP